MDVLIVVLFVLFVLAVVVTVAGHLMWLGAREIIRFFFLSPEEPPSPPRYSYDPLNSQLRDLETTEKQIVRFYSEGKLVDEIYEHLMKQIRAERANLARPKTAPASPRPQPASPHTWTHSCRRHTGTTRRSSSIGRDGSDRRDYSPTS